MFLRVNGGDGMITGHGTGPPIREGPDKPVRRRARRPAASSLLLLFFLLVIVLSGFGLFRIWLEYERAEAEYHLLQESHLLQGDASIDDSDEALVPDSFPDIHPDVDALLSENPDFRAWIYYADGNMNYPVVKEPEGQMNAYLHRTFEGQKNSAGCLFLPYDASEGFSDLNTFIYGHNMKNGSMFGSLKQLYRDPEKLQDPYFYIWTKDHEKIMYRLVAMQVVDKTSPLYSVPLDLDGYRTYTEQCLEGGSVDGFLAFSEADKQALSDGKPWVTLSTCYGSAGTRKRLLLQGVELLRMPF